MMKERQFDKLVRTHFGDLLEPRGFSCVESRYSTFYRKISEDIFHIIIANLKGGGAYFDIMVYATSPLIEPDFENLFPDDLGVPSDVFSFLSTDSGVGSEETDFRCNKEEGFVRNFERQAAPAILKYALPYLDGIQTIKDLIPYIRHDFYSGLALWHTGDRERGIKIIKSEINRLSPIVNTTKKYSTRLRYLEDLLKPKLIS